MTILYKHTKFHAKGETRSNRLTTNSSVMVSYQQINPEREKTYMTVQFPKGLVLAILHTLYTVEGSDFLSELGLSRAKSHTVLAVFLIYLFAGESSPASVNQTSGTFAARYHHFLTFGLRNFNIYPYLLQIANTKSRAPDRTALVLILFE